MAEVTYNPNVLATNPNAVPAFAQMGQEYTEVKMEHRGRGIKPHAHGRKRRRSRR